MNKRERVLRALKLEYTLSLFLAFFLYFFLSQAIFSTSPIVVSEETSPHLFSTETKSPLKSSLLYAIDHAQKKITILIYNLCDHQILQKLREASQRGVDVTVIADPYSSKDLEKSLSFPIHVYLRKPKGLMHLKIFILDGREVWLGSANMSQSSLESHGNLCTAFSSKVLSDYLEKFARSLIDTQAFALPPLHLVTKEQHLSLFLHPFHGEESFQYLLERINKASKRIFVAMYTFTNKPLVDSLVKASLRGVSVKVLFDKDSAKNTSKMAFTHLKKLSLPVGTRTTQGLLHHKFALIDDTLAMGSCNWTKAGFYSNCDCIFWLEPLTPSQNEHMCNLWQKIESASTLQ